MTPETTITATIHYPTASIEAFAERRGYMEQVEDENNPGVFIPNPETKIDFVQRMFRKHSLQWLSQDIESAVRAQKEPEIKAAVDVEKSKIDAAINITAT